MFYLTAENHVANSRLLDVDPRRSVRQPARPVLLEVALRRARNRRVSLKFERKITFETFRRGQPLHDMDPTDNKEMFFYQVRSSRENWNRRGVFENWSGFLSNTVQKISCKKRWFFLSWVCVKNDQREDLKKKKLKLFVFLSGRWQSLHPARNPDRPRAASHQWNDAAQGFRPPLQPGQHLPVHSRRRRRQQLGQWISPG